MSPETLTVIVAVQHAQDNLSAILDSLDPDGHPDVDFMFCYTDADPKTPERVSGMESVRVLQCAPGSLIPHLWRDGMLQARGARVAVTTAHCIPSDGWVRRLADVDMSGTAGVGGVIDNSSGSDSRGWAIYFLRYISFASPQTAREVDEIAADNAVYRLADILPHKDLLKAGFWEPSYHARFRMAGLKLRLDPDIRVEHRNRYSTSQFFLQRYAHGKAFGLERAGGLGVPKRLLLIVLSPVLPALFLVKILGAVRANGRHTSRLASAFPWLLLFLTAWGLGEARGYIESLCSGD